jgi:uncharacterized RDD family membrane protein YckC
MLTTGITTALNVDINVKPAGVFPRVGAFLIDAIIVTILLLGAVFLMAQAEGMLSALPLELMVVGYALLAVSPLMYPMVCELLMNGRTLGKSAVNICVVRADGRQLRLFDVAVRWLFLLVEVFATGGSLAIVCILFSKKAQRIGDMVAGTLVVEVPPRVSLAKVMALTSAPEIERTLVFPSVSRLSDAEIKTIRAVIDEATRSNIRVEARVSALWTLRDGVARKLGVDSGLGAEEFLQTVLADYAVLRG